ncbi:MAG: ComEC family competence protein [Hymenobacteraceae bacterium]|nr:ComEC family competence protein [Hymenobacteraceae bacterium]
MGRDLGYTTEVSAFFVSAFLVATFLSWRYKTSFATDLAGLLGLLSFVALGLSITQQRTETHHPHHLSKLAATPTHYVGKVEDYVLQKPGYQSTVLRVEQVKVGEEWQQVSGRVQLSVPHDSEQAYELNYGDVLLVKGAPQQVAAPANPNQFDYRQYLANKNIYHQHYLQLHQYQVIGSDPSFSLLHFSIQVRRYLDEVLRERIAERREYAIASALILGVKDELDNSIRQAYADTGTMHVLAVSGLHVGLIYSVLMLLLAYFNKTTRQRVLSAVLVLAVLWLYAFVTGLSPSVLRAVLMFSLVTIGLALRRRTVIYNTVAIAALVLLLTNPYNLLEVGFQLSFLAVLGIVYLQPRFYNLLQFDNRGLDFIWAYFTVALAAQLATFPLGLFYFHQFPVYFWLANVVVVPLATLVLYSGMAALTLSWVPWLSMLLFQLHFGFIWGMNEFNLLVQRMPQALINGIDITLGQTVLLYALLLLLILFLAMKRLRFLAFAVLVVALLSGQEVVEAMQQKEQKLLAVYNVRGATGMALVEGQEAVLLTDSALLRDENKYTFNVRPHLWQLGVQQPVFASLAEEQPLKAAHTLLPDSNQLLVWQGQRWLLLSNPPKLQPTDTIAIDYILLRNNVRLKPEELQGYTFRQVVLDASNSTWYRQRMHQQLDTLWVNYHDVAEGGAFVLQLQ